MTAAVLSRRKDPKGLRLIDPRRDMWAIADLIESAFPLDFDPAGRRMVREMRAYGRAGVVGYWLGRIFLPPAAFPLGYVWEQNGAVVGSASLLRVDGFPERWVLANVAVKAEYRRQGIARELTKASVDLAKQRKAKELFLQVDSSNQGPQILYASMGFHPLVTRSNWVRSAKRSMVVDGQIGLARERREQEWKSQLSLAERLHPEGLVWPYPLTSTLYRHRWMQQIFSTQMNKHWVWVEDDQLMGSLSARSRVDNRKLRFILVVDPEMRGIIERPLLTKGLSALADTQREILLDYPVGLADQDLETLGFTARRTLTWMSKEL